MMPNPITMSRPPQGGFTLSVTECLGFARTPGHSFEPRNHHETRYPWQTVCCMWCGTWRDDLTKAVWEATHGED